MGQDSHKLRELVRILIRNLGVLEKSDASCCGITLTQCHALVEIGRKSKISLVDLAEMLKVDKSTMSRTINNLVDANLVARDTDAENRRYVVIRLTRQGQETVDGIETGMDEYYEGILEAIPGEKRAQVTESLTLLTDAIRRCKCC